MGYKIIGNEINYPESHIVWKLTEFILKNPSYLKLFGTILIRAKNSRREKMTQKCIDTAIEANEISQYALPDFLKLLSEFYEEEDRTNNKVRGNIVEFLIARIAPITFKEENVSKLKECIIEDMNQNKVGGDNNFDVGVHCPYDNVKELTAELIEGKADLNNFISEEPFNNDNKRMKQEAIDKLNFMVAVKAALSHSKHLVVALATIRYDVAMSAELINSYGYTNINIFTLNHLQECLYSQYPISS